MTRKGISAWLATLVVIGLASAAYLAAQPGTEPPTVMLLYPKQPGDGLLWPTDRSWIWSVNRLGLGGKGTQFALVARVVHLPAPAKEQSPAIPLAVRSITKADCEAEISVGKIVLAGAAIDSAVVSVQLVDSRPMEVPAATEKPTLRLLLRLQTGGSMLVNDGVANPLHGIVVGHAVNPQAEWSDGELHLQNIYLRTGDRIAIYDVVVVRKE